MRIHQLPFLAFFVLLLGGCAATGSRSPSAGPVLYPNASYNTMGESKARQEVAVCTASATGAGLAPEQQDNAVAHGAAKGAAVGGVTGAVGALVRGRSLEQAVERGAGGAVVGAAAGATAGAFKEKPNQTYRHYIQRCLRDKGLEVIGWN
jgi:outer membrane lipoprotein SlyB